MEALVIARKLLLTVIEEDGSEDRKGRLSQAIMETEFDQVELEGLAGVLKTFVSKQVEKNSTEGEFQLDDFGALDQVTGWNNRLLMGYLNALPARSRTTPWSERKKGAILRFFSLLLVESSKEREREKGISKNHQQFLKRSGGDQGRDRESILRSQAVTRVNRQMGQKQKSHFTGIPQMRWRIAKLNTVWFIFEDPDLPGSGTEFINEVYGPRHPYLLSSNDNPINPKIVCINTNDERSRPDLTLYQDLPSWKYKNHRPLVFIYQSTTPHYLQKHFCHHMSEFQRNQEWGPIVIMRKDFSPCFWKLTFPKLNSDQLGHSVLRDQKKIWHWIEEDCAIVFVGHNQKAKRFHWKKKTTSL